MKRPWLYFTLLFSTLSAWFIYKIVFKEQFAFEIFLSWMIATINFYTGMLVKILSAKLSKQDGVLFVLKWNIIKLVLLVTILFFLMFKRIVHVPSFIISFFVIYWLWTIYDVLSLHFQSLGNNKRHE